MGLDLGAEPPRINICEVPLLGHGPTLGVRPTEVTKEIFLFTC